MNEFDHIDRVHQSRYQSQSLHLDIHSLTQLIRVLVGTDAIDELLNVLYVLADGLDVAVKLLRLGRPLIGDHRCRRRAAAIHARATATER